MRLVSKFWQDTRGAVSVAEIVLVSTIVIIGSIAGMTTLRDQIVQGFGDVADAVLSLDQSYTVTSSYATFGWTDPGPFPSPSSGNPPAGIEFGGTAAEEN